MISDGIGGEMTGPWMECTRVRMTATYHEMKIWLTGKTVAIGDPIRWHLVGLSTQLVHVVVVVVDDCPRARVRRNAELGSAHQHQRIVG